MACIYQIKNLTNNKFYIGSTQNTLLKRKGEHICELKGNYHCNNHLQSSWNKYGEDNFKFEVIEEFKFPENYDSDYIYEYVTSRELYYITTLNPQYNIMREIKAGKLGREVSKEQREAIGNRSRGRKCTPETIQKIKDARAKQVITEETKRKISERLKGTTFQRGRKQSIEQKQENSRRVLEQIEQGIGMHSIESKTKRTATVKVKFNTPEMRVKLKYQARNRNHRVFLCFKDNVLVGEFLSQADTADLLNLKSSEVCAVLRKDQKTTKGYSFKYKEI